jgi:predicted HTH domain antitoxin
MCTRIRVELALELYKTSEASLAKSAELAGLTTGAFEKLLADRGIKREIELDGTSVQNSIEV